MLAFFWLLRFVSADLLVNTFKNNKKDLCHSKKITPRHLCLHCSRMWSCYGGRLEMNEAKIKPPSVIYVFLCVFIFCWFGSSPPWVIAGQRLKTHPLVYRWLMQESAVAQPLQATRRFVSATRSRANPISLHASVNKRHCLKKENKKTKTQQWATKNCSFSIPPTSQDHMFV